MSNFNDWLDTFLQEKGIDSESMITPEGDSGLNIMPVGVVIERIKSAPSKEQEGIKRVLVDIDFRNASVMHFLEHLAKAIAK